MDYDWEHCGTMQKITRFMLQIINFIGDVLYAFIMLVVFLFNTVKFFFVYVLPNIDIFLLLGEIAILAYIIVSPGRNPTIQSMIMNLIYYNYIMFKFLVELITAILRTAYRTINWLIAAIRGGGVAGV
jgi:hypothetical protein